ncbi:Fic family protein [Actinoplanes sp. LDG1-06]|uniref:Fic family protein n=1 Tax=Paractinoplanes ovalisporus TaxID=2810368 RepID=A0ABS2A547_9ACTN|nr:Fic family protein [Actinoplanes ovalisporus]MBM2614965.1 Fic family protein [Actinoplanes ovalisporus]
MAAWLHVRSVVPWRDVVPFPRPGLAAPGTSARPAFNATLPAYEAGRPAFDAASPAGEAHFPALDSPALPAFDVAARLTPELTARWNAAVRGIPFAEFRRGPAYAKNGRERYALHADTESRYADCLAETADTRIPVTARAARAYLDVAFFHPYADGNGRLAGLVLQFVLAREGIELDDLAPILTTVRRADDAEGAAGLARMVHGTAEATRRRRARRSHPSHPPHRPNPPHPSDPSDSSHPSLTEPVAPLAD